MSDLEGWSKKIDDENEGSVRLESEAGINDETGSTKKDLK